MLSQSCDFISHESSPSLQMFSKASESPNAYEIYGSVTLKSPGMTATDRMHEGTKVSQIKTFGNRK